MAFKTYTDVYFIIFWSDFILKSILWLFGKIHIVSPIVMTFAVVYSRQYASIHGIPYIEI